MREALTTIKVGSCPIIHTRYLGPTHTLGSRIVAERSGIRVTIALDYELSLIDAHGKAAQALCAKLGWDAVGLRGGSSRDNRGYSFAVELADERPEPTHAFTLIAPRGQRPPV